MILVHSTSASMTSSEISPGPFNSRQMFVCGRSACFVYSERRRPVMRKHWLMLRDSPSNTILIRPGRGIMSSPQQLKMQHVGSQNLSITRLCWLAQKPMSQMSLGAMPAFRQVPPCQRQQVLISIQARSTMWPGEGPEAGSSPRPSTRS